MPFNKEQQRIWIRKRRADRRKYSLHVLGGKCVKCGTKEKLHLHHKDKNIKEIETKDLGTVRWERFVAEIAKCELLCTHCHTIHHNFEKYGKQEKEEDGDMTYEEWDEMIQPFRK